MLTKCVNGLKSKHTAILGAQWGDEGKGKLVDKIAEGAKIGPSHSR